MQRDQMTLGLERIPRQWCSIASGVPGSLGPKEPGDCESRTAALRKRIEANGPTPSDSPPGVRPTP